MPLQPSLPDDLQELLDSLYKSGYLPQYLQEELSESEKMDGDYLDFPITNNTQGNVESLNHPSLFNYEKAVFVPPESEYKNILFHKDEKSHQKLAPLLEPPFSMQVENRFPILEPQDLRGEFMAPLIENIQTKNIADNISNFDFLLPIPEKGKNPTENILNENNFFISSKVSPKIDGYQPINIPTRNMLPINGFNQKQMNGYSIITQQTPFIPREVERHSLPKLTIQQAKTGAPLQSENLLSKTNTTLNQFPPNKNLAINSESQTMDHKNIGTSLIDNTLNANKQPVIPVHVVENDNLVTHTKTPNEQANQLVQGKKHFSILNIFRKGGKRIEAPETKTMNKTKDGQDTKLATLQELYNNLIDDRNRDENYILLDPYMGTNLINIIPQNNHNLDLQETEYVQKPSLGNIEKDILNEPEISQCIYKMKRRK